MKKYPKYKDSGIEWIGAIPEHWDVKKLKYIKSHEKNSFVDGPFGSNLKTEHFIENGEVYVIDSGFVTSGKFELHRDFKTISLDHFETVKRSQCKKDDIIISKIGANFGMSGILPDLGKPSLVSGNTLKLTINKEKYYLDLIHLQLLNLKQFGEIDLLVKGSAQPALSMGAMSDLPFVVSSNLSEQTAIANYLDRKTEEINTLITNKEKLIELLKEERTAIINHAIDSNDFKEISIRYLVMSGQLEHQDGNHGEIHPIASEYVDSGIPFIMANHIVNSRIDYNNCKFISKERASKLRIGFAKEFDVLLTHKGTIGRVGIVKNSKTDFVILTPQVTYYRCKQNINYEYLSLVFQSDYFQTQLAEKASNGTTREYVGLLAQRDLKVRLPHSIEDQIRIANKLNKELETNGLIISKTEKEIELLNEYKAALISEVVTGKVDVREEVIV